MNQADGNKDPENLPSKLVVSTPIVIPDRSESVFIDDEPLDNPSKSKYADSRWKQQTKRGWRPSLKFPTLWKGLLIIGLVLLAIGGFLLWITWDKDLYVTLDYTDCMANVSSNESCSKTMKTRGDECMCSEQIINIPRDLSDRVMISYELTEFFQNQRHYLTSKDEDQLLGHLFLNGNPIKPDIMCKPIDHGGDDNKQTVYPCGKLANSFFTDDFVLLNHLDEEIPLTKFPCWSSDKKFKYAIPAEGYNDTKFKENFIKPPAWSEETYQRFLSDGGVTGDDFCTWMRGAAFGDFQKPFRTFQDKVSTCKDKKGLCKGDYKLRITYRFESKSYDGRKKIVIAKDTLLTDEKNFLCFAFFTIASIFLILAVMSYIFSRVSIGKVDAVGVAKDEVNYQEDDAYHENETIQNTPTKPPEQMQLQKTEDRVSQSNTE